MTRTTGSGLSASSASVRLESALVRPVILVVTISEGNGRAVSVAGLRYEKARSKSAFRLSLSVFLTSVLDPTGNRSVWIVRGLSVNGRRSSSVQLQHERGVLARRTGGGLCLCEVRGLDVVRGEVDDLHLLGLELSALGRTVEGGTENGGLIGVDVLSDLVPGRERAKTASRVVSRHTRAALDGAKRDSLSDGGLDGRLDHGHSRVPTKQDQRVEVGLESQGRMIVSKWIQASETRSGRLTTVRFAILRASQIGFSYFFSLMIDAAEVSSCSRVKRDR